jgi:hypothetical protein
MRDNMENMYKTKITLKSGDDDWYKNANYITDLLQVNHNILPRDLNKYAIQHYLDTMNISDKIILLKELFDGGEHELAEDEKQIYQYLEKFIVKFGENRIGIFMADGPKNTIYISENKDGRMAWEEGSADDYLRSPQDFRVDPRNISNMIGFIAPFKSGEMVFKLKQLNTKRNKIGIKSVYADLSTLLNKINQLCGKVVYTKNPFIKKMVICILLEILMREHLDKYGDTKPIEFFPPELAIINNIQVL